VLLSSGDKFPHLIQKRRSQLGFVTYLLNYPRILNRIVHLVGFICEILQYQLCA